MIYYTFTTLKIIIKTFMVFPIVTLKIVYGQSERTPFAKSKAKMYLENKCNLKNLIIISPEIVVIERKEHYCS